MFEILKSKNKKSKDTIFKELWAIDFDKINKKKSKEIVFSFYGFQSDIATNSIKSLEILDHEKQDLMGKYRHGQIVLKIKSKSIFNTILLDCLESDEKGVNIRQGRAGCGQIMIKDNTGKDLLGQLECIGWIADHEIKNNIYRWEFHFAIEGSRKREGVIWNI